MKKIRCHRAAGNVPHRGNRSLDGVHVLSDRRRRSGIDGFIELRDDGTGEVGNPLQQVQDKATERERLQMETEKTFEFACADADIEYWTKGKAPVLLIVVALKTRKAYWKSLKEWFADPRSVVFEEANLPTLRGLPMGRSEYNRNGAWWQGGRMKPPQRPHMPRGEDYTCVRIIFSE
ncbi:DUF4365 domain-containing protein [Bradyrhizobium sp. CCGUVB23]|uniref:DUF4365 domain-containing protein n=1 Tax=Bradyrhizobium sp. CCGUVB23 TaxID=2949630 RepID=UPI0020B38E8F|nr:DUF4365 domain-containing protein [Bradyrhizobium sp. CCGUVB23]MCP3463584.1 DUF4365 domain-containing protein [Bradyrhizobium sp. CCGUVB23]